MIALAAEMAITCGQCVERFQRVFRKAFLASARDLSHDVPAEHRMPYQQAAPGYGKPCCLTNTTMTIPRGDLQANNMRQVL